MFDLEAERFKFQGENLLGTKESISQVEWLIAILTVTSPIVINVPTRGLLAVETKDSFVLWLAKSKYQKNCL